MPITATDRTLALNYALGEAREQYLSGPPRGLAGCYSIILLFVSLIFIVSAIAAWSEIAAGDGFIIAFLLLIGLLFLCLAFLYSPLWPLVAARYILCDEGLVCIRPFARQQRERAVRWEQIDEIYYDWQQRIKLAFHNSESEGESLRISIGSAKKPCRLPESIAEQAMQRLLPQVLERFYQGELLAFGPIKVDPGRGVHYQERTIGWEQIGACDITDRLSGVRFSLLDTNKQRLLDANAYQIPNVMILRTAIDEALDNAPGRNKADPRPDRKSSRKNRR